MVLNDKAEGEFMKYLINLSFTNDFGKLKTVRGMVYDSESCSLMTAINSSITNVTSVSWTAADSLKFIRDYFLNYENDWNIALTASCAHFSVVLPEFSTLSVTSSVQKCTKKQCILGVGASGRVFQCTHTDSLNIVSNMAIKVVIGESNAKELVKEYQLIQALPPGATDLIVGVVQVGVFNTMVARPNGQYIQVASFLLPTVGEPFERFEDVTDEHACRMLESLSDLHAAGVAHNDARYNNVVIVRTSATASTYRWIDFRTTTNANTVAFTCDVDEFLKSLNRKLPIEMRSNLTDIVNRTYSNDPGFTAQLRRLSIRGLWYKSVQI